MNCAVCDKEIQDSELGLVHTFTGWFECAMIINDTICTSSENLATKPEVTSESGS